MLYLLSPAKTLDYERPLPRGLAALTVRSVTRRLALPTPPRPEIRT